MPRRPTYVFNIARPHAPLTRRDPNTRRFDFAREERFERRHARSDHQQCRIVFGYERRTRQTQMPALLLKEFQKCFAQLIAGHVFQAIIPPM